MSFASIPEILEDILLGKPVIIVDDETRENEGDLIIAAECVTSEAIAFMATKGCGLICLAMEESQAAQLGLPLVAGVRWDKFSTAFTVSIEAAKGVTTGISAHDRSHTIQTAIQDIATAMDIVTPGHVFPIVARKSGVLERAGHTEAAVDLARLAGLKPAGVIVEIMLPSGEMARVPDLIPYAKEHGLKIGTIKDLIAWRLRTETLLAICDIPAPNAGEGGIIHGFSRLYDGGGQHVAVVHKNEGYDKDCSVLLVTCNPLALGEVYCNPAVYAKHHQAIQNIQKQGGIVLFLSNGTENFIEAETAKILDFLSKKYALVYSVENSAKV